MNTKTGRLKEALDRIEAWLPNAQLAAWTLQDLRTIRFAARRQLASESTEGHYHRWEVIDETTVLVRCSECGAEGYK